MSQIIEDFISGYQREFDFYQEVARLVFQRSDKLLQANGIRAIVTYRAKSHDRLKDKLLKRNPEKNYTSAESIRSDIVDFAGVRIALYFPGDRERIEQIINREFVDVVRKGFPEKNHDEQKRRRFSGYHATHYRVRLRENDLSESQLRYAEAIVEIQVASVLMHAWSEVNHDLGYKPLSGELSIDEDAILDELNGLVMSGEIALERLQRAVEMRVAKRGSTFTNQYELAVFLYDELKSKTPKSAISPDAASDQKPVEREPLMGRVDILFMLLRLAQRNDPEALRTYIEDLEQGPESSPIADQIVDKILAEHPELYEKFLEQKASIDRRSPYQGDSTQADGEDTLIGRFFTQWIRFERFYRELIVKRRPPGTAVTAFPRLVDLHTLFPEDPATVAQLDLLRRLRNRTVHGLRTPSADTLSSAIAQLTKILDGFRKSSDPDIRYAIQQAFSKD